MPVLAVAFALAKGFGFERLLQDLIVESALTGDPDLALQALIADPNSPPDERACRAMFDELMELQAAELPF